VFVSWVHLYVMPSSRAWVLDSACHRPCEVICTWVDAY
jgi:hypothetical protein